MSVTKNRPKLAAVLVVSVLVLAVAACGGGSSSSAPSVVSKESTTTTTRASSSATTTSGGSGSSDLSDALGAAGAAAGSCIELSLAYASVSLSLLSGGFGAALGADRTELNDASKQLQDIQADVPAELKDDFATLEKGFQSFSSALDGGTGNILDPAYQQQLETAGKALETPEFTAAQKNIEDYLDAKCK